MARINIVCSECGSDDVRRDAWACWDVEAQEWTLGEVFDQGFCAACDGEARLDAQEIGAEPVVDPLTALNGLLEWAERAGGWDAPAWSQARATRDALIAQAEGG